MSRAAGALACGVATLALTTAACLLAWGDGSPLHPRAGGRGTGGGAWLFLVLAAAALAAYVLALVVIRRRGAPLVATAAVAAAVQLAPLAAPLLLSTDAWTYWAYGRVAAVEGGNPYRDSPSAYPDSPALDDMGAAWRDTTSVYGPAFTLVSEPLALAAGTSEVVAAWEYKALAALAALAAALLAARVAARPALALAFAGWNPVLAIHLAGGGHNDALVGALVVGALALSAGRRPGWAGVAWTLAIAVKWIPVVLLALWALGRHAAGRSLARPAAAVATTTAAVAALATWRYGAAWLEVLGPLKENAGLETSYALPHRLEQLGVPDAAATATAVAVLVLGLVLLARRAARGAPTLGRASVLALATTPWLAVWYLGWAVPVVASEEDRAAWIACLGFCAYLLPQTVPL